MFVTDDEALYETVLTLSNHGRARGQTKQFWPDMVGFKYKMSNVQAAIGCAQMERIDELTARKHAIFETYLEQLGSLNSLSFNPEPEGTRNGAWMPTVVIDRDLGITREQMVSAFASNNIDARVFFHPLSSLPMFQPVPGNRHAYDIPERAINLPSYHDMTDEQITRVADVIKTLVNP
jgi:perosamine synthetase